jgi:hypothetical protein
MEIAFHSAHGNRFPKSAENSAALAQMQLKHRFLKIG